jgi:hypothetical protein
MLPAARGVQKDAIVPLDLAFAAHRLQVAQRTQLPEGVREPTVLGVKSLGVSVHTQSVSFEATLLGTMPGENFTGPTGTGHRLNVKNLTKEADTWTIPTIIEAGIKTKDDGSCESFGYVILKDEDEAKAAIEALNAKDIGGKTLQVSPLDALAIQKFGLDCVLFSFCPLTSCVIRSLGKYPVGAVLFSVMSCWC